ncbi:MAG: ACP S-malonyltransferase [Gammaproteobacteria bacterium]|nr:ACP S-malonyltransferase [Gammaproteobacteria bacterium]
MKTAFLFPGQGSQAQGMLSESADAVSQTFEEASEALGYDLWNLVQQGPLEQLNQTEFTQPALLTASIALWRLWTQAGGSADFVAGHSLGEYSALVASSVLSLQDGVRIVQKRGQLMQAAVPLGAGGMAAVMGLDDDKILIACRQATHEVDSGSVQPANLNAPGQVVISGTQAALDRAIALCQTAGAKRAIPLNVSAPFHSELMRPAADDLRATLDEVKFMPPTIDVVQNVLAASCSDIDSIKSNLVTQLYSAVRWTESIQYLLKAGVTQVVECGPGKVLTGLNKRIERTMTTANLDSIASIAPLRASQT